MLETIPKVLAVIFTAIGGMYQWRNFRHRSKLKADLEILKLYNELASDTPAQKALKQHIEDELLKMYSRDRMLEIRDIRFLKVTTFICALLALIGFLSAAGLFLGGHIISGILLLIVAAWNVYFAISNIKILRLRPTHI
jgi:hypothetical protein